jgi:hypothetical protein
VPVDIQLGKEARQIWRVAAAAFWPCPTRATGPQGYARPPQPPGNTLPVEAS